MEVLTGGSAVLVVLPSPSMTGAGLLLIGAGYLDSVPNAELLGAGKSSEVGTSKSSIKSMGSLTAVSRPKN